MFPGKYFANLDTFTQYYADWKVNIFLHNKEILYSQNFSHSKSLLIFQNLQTLFDLS